MGIFDAIRSAGRPKAAFNIVAGNTDFLEAACAIAAYQSASEGGIDQEESDKAMEILLENNIIAANFTPEQVETCFERMKPKTKSYSGRAGLLNEIREVIAKDGDGSKGSGKQLILIAIDVASVGDISDKEWKTLEALSGVCKVDFNKLKAGTL